jgi:hypothetical protein
MKIESYFSSQQLHRTVFLHLLMLQTNIPAHDTQQVETVEEKDMEIFVLLKCKLHEMFFHKRSGYT